MIELYLFLSYTIMLGMMIETYYKRSIPTEAYFMFALSPFILPVLIGMILTEKSKDNE
jgi:hypothetical protein